MSESIRIEGPTPRTWSVVKGAHAEFRCSVAGPATRVLQWKVGKPGANLEAFKAVPGATGEALSLEATKDGDYVLVVKPTADASEGTQTSNRAELRVVEKPISVPWEYDAAFTRDTFRRLTVIWLAPIVTLVAGMALATRALGEQIVPALVALQLLAVGTALALAAAYVALMEVRGISRAAKVSKDEPEEGGVGAAGEGGAPLEAASPLEEVAKSAPKIIETFGKLRVSAALMLLTATVLLAAAVLGWRALPSSDDAAEGGATPAAATATVAAETPAAAPPATEDASSDG